MREMPVAPRFALRRWVWASMFGILIGVGFCKIFWPTERIREVPVVTYREKKVEVPVEVIKYVDRVVERRVEVPVIKEVVRVVEKPVEVKPTPVIDGPTPYELEDWGKLRRSMSRDTVRVLLGDPVRVSGSSPEMWYFPFGGSVTFNFEGKLESWQVPGFRSR